MLVIATAGHVDHGKSTLLRRLTGMEPDRWEEERRRGLTIDLGFVWTQIGTETIAFVDVPGHERFLPNMLAGAGTVPAALFVVAADEGWKPQSAEHLLALEALGVRNMILVISKADLADPAPAAAQALAECRRTRISVSDALCVSAFTGAGIEPVREQLAQLSQHLEHPDPDADVRLWIDRVFTVKGAGTVVTGTLTGGTIRSGDGLDIARTGEHVVVRSLESLGLQQLSLSAIGRVALNLRGISREGLRRGDVLATPGTYRLTGSVDIRLDHPPADRLSRALTCHVGSASVPATWRALGAETLRLELAAALPLRTGDRLVLCHDHRVVAAAVALDVVPPALSGPRAAQRRGVDLRAYSDVADPEAELARRRLIRADDLHQMGIAASVVPAVAGWHLDPGYRRVLRQRLDDLVAARAGDPGAGPLSVEQARVALDLPDRRLVEYIASADVVIRAGTIGTADGRDLLAPHIREAFTELLRDARSGTLQTSSSAGLAAVGLSPLDVSAALRAGSLQRLAPDIFILPAALEAVVVALAALPSPFRLGDARAALGTTRRVAVPLLEFLARKGVTRRTPDGLHMLRAAETAPDPVGPG